MIPLIAIFDALHPIENVAKLTHTFLKPAIVGATATLATAVILDGNASIIAFGMAIPAPILAGVTVGVASGVTAFSEEYVLNMLIGNKLGSLTGMVLAPSLTGLATVGLLRFSGLGESGTSSMAQMFALGVGSEVGGAYIYGSLAPMFGTSTAQYSPEFG